MNHWRVVGVVSLWQVAASICYYTVFAATTFFRSEFGLSRFTVGLVVTSLTLGYAAFLLPLGALVDRYGEWRTLVGGLVGLAAGTLVVVAAWSLPSLLVAAFLLGSAYGTAMPGTNKAILESIPPGRRNLAIGIKQVGVTAGSGISALLVTGLAATWLGWEGGFVVAAAVALVVTGVFAIGYEDDAPGDGSGYPDFRGLLGNRAYVSLTGAGFFLGAGLFTTVGYTILYVEEFVGASVVFAGAVLAVVQVAGSVGRIAGGWLSDALPGEPRRRIGAILLVQSLAGVVLFVAVTLVRTPVAALVAFAGLGFFVLGFTGVYYSCMATLVPEEEIGGATAGGQLALTSGALVAPPAFGFLSDVAGYRAGWLLLAALGCVAAAFLLDVIRTSPER